MCFRRIRGEMACRSGQVMQNHTPRTARFRRIHFYTAISYVIKCLAFISSQTRAPAFDITPDPEHIRSKRIGAVERPLWSELKRPGFPGKPGAVHFRFPIAVGWRVAKPAPRARCAGARPVEPSRRRGATYLPVAGCRASTRYSGPGENSLLRVLRERYGRRAALSLIFKREAFIRLPSTLVWHGAPIVRPGDSDQFELRGRLAVVIGRAGRRIPRELARDYVAGYAPFCDTSVREWRRPGRSSIPAMNFPMTCGIGPWMSTREASRDEAGLHVTTRVNGTEIDCQLGQH